MEGNKNGDEYCMRRKAKGGRQKRKEKRKEGEKKKGERVIKEVGYEKWFIDPFVQI
jgi:hypothetical protein